MRRQFVKETTPGDIISNLWNEEAIAKDGEKTQVFSKKSFSPFLNTY